MRILSESEKIILETLINEAEHKIRTKIKEGTDVGVAITEVADDMELDKSEIEDLQTIFREPKKALATKDNPHPNSIYFKNSDDVDSAIGVLMYNNIPWESKDEDSYIQFNDQDTLEKAMKALNRKWDFIDNKRNNVATISFDNISDYKKVLDFINRSGMFINFDEDVKLDKEDDDTSKEDNNGRSFKSEPKKIKEKIDPQKNKDQRALVVRKRFN